MLLYSIVVIAIIALSSIAFTCILHRHKPVDANTFIVITLSSLFVLVLSLCFPFLYAAIINLASRTKNTLRVIVGFSVILLIYILAISRFAHFIFMFISENKNTRLQAFMDKINAAGLSNYFLYLMRLKRKPISAVGRSGAVSALFAESAGTGAVMEDINPQQPEGICDTQHETKEPCTVENITITVQQDTVPDQPTEHTADILSEAIDVINEESSLIDEEKPVSGIPEEIMQTLEEAATVDERVVSDFDEYIKVASQMIDVGAEAAASEICSEAESESDVEEFGITENAQDEIMIMISSQAEQETVEIEPHLEEEFAEVEEVVSEVQQVVSQEAVPEVEAFEDNYPENSEEPVLEQLETSIATEDSVISVSGSYITMEEAQPEHEEALAPVPENEEGVPEVEQAVSQDIETEVEIFEDNYSEISEEPVLEQLETSTTVEESVLPVSESYITIEEVQPEQDVMAVEEFEAHVYEEVAPAAEIVEPVEEQAAGYVETVEASIDSYIDEAFRFKQEGDYESAILYYMYALDSKPEDSLVFWVILDICVLYKEMGQIELAKQILESYVELYGNVMDQQVRDEIMRNLTEE